MKSKIILILTGTLLTVCSASNLVKNGEFSLYPKSYGKEYRQISKWKSSRFELFTEPGTKNKCGKLRIVALESSAVKGLKLGTAVVAVGSDGKTAGFKCKPNTVYSYSLQLKGGTTRAFCWGIEWKKNGTLWQFRDCKKSKKIFSVGKEWKTVQGTFKTGPDADRAALAISIWWDGQYKKDKNILKPGDYMLIDNIKVSEVKP